MKKRYLAFLLILLTSLLLLGSCNKDKFKPESVHLQYSSFKSLYRIDEELNLDGVKLRLVNGKGQYRDIECTMDMIVGFDTTTTGQKKLYAVYEGLNSNEIVYQVYNNEDASRQIVTKTRIEIMKTVSEEKTTFELSLRSCDLNVRALSFRINAVDASFRDGLPELNGTTLGNMNDFYWTKKANDAINVLLSGDTPQSSGAFFRLEWEGTDRSVTISDVVVSDGEQDYYLPIAK